MIHIPVLDTTAAPTMPRQTSKVDVNALEADLRQYMAGEVRFDTSSRGLYATNASNYRQVPIGVVIPHSINDVVAAVAACHRHQAPIVSRGGGTSLAGQCCNVANVDMATYKAEAMTNVLNKMGLRFEEPESGCCGMAGAFGFEAEHYDISRQIGERHLLPSVRQAAKDTLIIANGFSCRTQIAQGSDRHPLHLSELLLIAFNTNPSAPVPS